MTAEARSVPEFVSFTVSVGPLIAALPRGDGRPVLVLPGLGANDASTAPLRWLLGRLGHRAYGWGLGRNEGFGAHVADGLDRLLATTADEAPVSVIGWSLGGIHAVELAQRHPAAVRSIITLGSPLDRRHERRTDIPMTSIFSRTDQIVPWHMSNVRAGPRREAVEVRGSHLGLGHNPAVAVVVADRLAQDEHEWRPFTPPRWIRHWYPNR